MSREVRRADRPILVTGATGRIGRLVVDELLRAGVVVRALTRRPATAALPASLEVLGGDLTVPSSLDSVLEGVSVVFLVWTPSLDAAPAVIERIAASGSAGRRRVVLLSSPHQTPHPFFQQPNALRGLHEGIERLLASSGLDVAIVRPGMFASNALYWWAPQIRRNDVVRWPYGAVETAPIDERDVAAVTARLLLDDEHARADYVLTGPESLSHADQVRTIGDAIGRPIGFQEMSPDEFRRETAATWPKPVVAMLLSAWQASVGQPAYVTAVVRELLGAPARTFAQWASDNAAAFLKSGDSWTP